MGVNGIYGLSGSGIDVESMVKVGMLTKQKQYDKMQQTYTKNEWTKQAYNEIYNKLTTYSTSTLSPYKMSSTMNAKSAVSSNTSAVTATANGNAVIMNHKVEVKSLSTSAYLVATESLKNVQSPNDNDSVELQDYLFKLSTYKIGGSGEADTLSIQDRNGEPITKLDVNGNEVPVDINDTAFEFKVSDGTEENGRLKTWTFKYTYGDLLGYTQKSNGKITDNDNAKTFNDFVSDFNALGTNIRASYDAVNGKFSFYNKTGGSSSQINFEMSSDTKVAETTANFFRGMELMHSKDGQLFNGDGTVYNDSETTLELASVQSSGTIVEYDGDTPVTGSTLLSDVYDLSTDARFNFGDELNFNVNGSNVRLTISEDGEFHIGDSTENATIDDLVQALNVDGVSASFKNNQLTLASTVEGGLTISGTNADDFFAAFNINTLTAEDVEVPAEKKFVGKYNDNIELASLQSDQTVVQYDGSTTVDSDTKLSDVNGLGAANTIFGDEINLDINGNNVRITITEDDEFHIGDSTEDATIDDLVQALNVDGVSAKFENGQLTLASTVKGQGLTISGTNADRFFDAFNISTLTAEDTEGSLSFGVHGDAGEVIIDGVKYDKLTDNSVNAYGVIYKFHNTTTDPVNINIEQDVDAIIDKVKSFVEEYNTLLGGIYDKYNEKQYKDYTPLTASQKETMKDEQIEKWEEKAKSGLLYHDQTLSKIATKMREAISNPIEGINGAYNSAYSIGISTTGIYGQLTLDEDKLRNALNVDSESVYNIFSTLSTDDDFDKNGIAQRLGDVMVDATKLVKDRAGTDDSINDDSDLGSLMRELQNKMSDFKKLLDAFEDRLYKKYDAMEVALSTLGMQLSYITGGQ